MEAATLSAFPAVLPSGSEGRDPMGAAFELAYFIHKDRTIALAICRDALQGLEVVAAAQTKRLYYRPRGRGRDGLLRAATRFRTSWEDRHLLQRLVYFESEAWERLQEERVAGSLSERDLLLRFAKHLSRITMRRNSFYASIAVGRIAHSYSTADTMGIYDLLASEDCERKQGDYFRARKAQLLDEIRVRFGDLLSFIRGPHQEERIETRQATPETIAWMRECLSAMKPWATPCGEAVRSGSADASDRGRPRDQDFDREEAGRFHTLFHPPCFESLARRLRIADPCSRLAIPRFHLRGEPPDQSDGGSQERSARLSPEERSSIERQLSEESGRRRGSPTRCLRVLVDGQEKARFDPAASGSFRFPLEESAEIIEVRASTPQGELRLALHALREEADGTAPSSDTFSIALEAGQMLSFRIEPVRGTFGAMSRTIEVVYRETDAGRAVRLAVRRLVYRARETVRLVAGTVQQPAGLAALLSVIVCVLLLPRLTAIRRAVVSATSASGPALSASREIARPLPPLSSDRPAPLGPSLRRPERSDQARAHRADKLRAGGRPGQAPEPRVARHLMTAAVPASEPLAPSLFPQDSRAFFREPMLDSDLSPSAVPIEIGALAFRQGVPEPHPQSLGSGASLGSKGQGGAPDSRLQLFTEPVTQQLRAPNPSIAAAALRALDDPAAPGFLAARQPRLSEWRVPSESRRIPIVLGVPTRGCEPPFCVSKGEPRSPTRGSGKIS